MRASRQIWNALAGQALLITVLPAGLLILNVHDGYRAELEARDAEHLNGFVAVATEAARAGRPLEQLIPELDLRDPDRLGGRLALFAPNGQKLAGPDGGTTRLERPVRLGERTVAVARIVREPQLTAGDRAFLARQDIGIGVVMGAVLVFLLLIAGILARRWARPQQDLRELSRAIVEGETVDGWDIDGPEEVTATARNLLRVSARFERLETARRTWLVSTAEELRCPTRSIGEQIDILASATPPADEAILTQLRTDHTEFSRMADDLQAVALADLGRLPVQFQQVDPRALIHNALYASRGRAEAHGVTLETDNLPQYTILVRWDGARIEQLFAALIDNSLRYTPRGGRIILGLEPHGDTWELLIDDSAPGVDVEMAQRLFEPFYRSSDSTASNVTGSGLGLATARAIVDAHHGRIEAGRSPIGGLRVSVRLPSSQPMA